MTIAQYGPLPEQPNVEQQPAHPSGPVGTQATTAQQGAPAAAGHLPSTGTSLDLVGLGLILLLAGWGLVLRAGTRRRQRERRAQRAQERMVRHREQPDHSGLPTLELLEELVDPGHRGHPVTLANVEQ